MHVYPIEASKDDLNSVLALAANGEEVIFTRNNRPLARLIPIREDEVYLKEENALEHFLMECENRSKEPGHRFSEEEIDAHQKRVRALRGILKGMDPEVARDDDRV